MRKGTKKLTARARDNCIRNSLATSDTRSSLGTYAKPCNKTKIEQSFSKLARAAINND